MPEAQPYTTAETVRIIEQVSAGGLPGLLGISVLKYDHGYFETELLVRDELLLAPGTVLHAGTALTLADTTAGWGCQISLPDDARGFTTIEGKANFLTTARAQDVLACEARVVHAGKTTQVWDATVRRIRDDRLVAAYRCTQSLLPQARVTPPVSG